MAVDMFLKLDGIDGESVDHAHEDEIDVLSFSWGVSQTGTMHVARGGGAGKASFDDLVVVKHVDKASPNLVKLSSMGSHISTAKLTVRKAGGDEPVEFVVIELKSVLVSSVNFGGSGEDERPTETISLNFAEFKYEYTPQASDGTPLPEVEFGFNIPKNEPA